MLKPIQSIYDGSLVNKAFKVCVFHQIRHKLTSIMTSIMTSYVSKHCQIIKITLQIDYFDYKPYKIDILWFFWQ